jgi:hypothetical protein
VHHPSALETQIEDESSAALIAIEISSKPRHQPVQEKETHGLVAQNRIIDPAAARP